MYVLRDFFTNHRFHDLMIFRRRSCDRIQAAKHLIPCQTSRQSVTSRETYDLAALEPFAELLEACQQASALFLQVSRLDRDGVDVCVVNAQAVTRRRACSGGGRTGDNRVAGQSLGILALGLVLIFDKFEGGILVVPVRHFGFRIFGGGGGGCFARASGEPV
jgi:hypothetical protein